MLAGDDQTQEELAHEAEVGRTRRATQLAAAVQFNKNEKLTCCLKCKH